MARGAGWIDDDALRATGARLDHELQLLISNALQRNPMIGVSPADLITDSIAADVEDLLEIGLPGLEANFAIVQQAYERLNADRIDALLDYLDTVAGRWQGAAARAYGAKVSNIRIFLEGYREEIENYLNRLAVAYRIAEETRLNFELLAESTIRVSQDFRADQAQKRRELAFKIVVGVGAAVLGLRDSMHRAMADLDAENRRHRSTMLGDNHELLIPLPPSARIHGVEHGDYFRFEEFATAGQYSDAPDPAAVDRRIVEETAPPASPDGAPSAIRDALEPR